MRFTATVVSIITSFTSLSQAATVHVPRDFPTIQEAINLTDIGDEILVSPGIYNEELNLSSPRAIRGNGPRETIVISGEGNHRCIEIRDGAAGFVLEGLTFANGFIGQGGLGAGIWAHDTGGEIRNCIIRDCACGSHGGGLYFSLGTNHSGTLDGCAFEGNESSGSGGGAYLQGSGFDLIIDCTFVGNVANSHGGGLRGSSVEVHDCYFGENSSGEFGGAVTSIQAHGCTFVDNLADQGGGAVHNSSAIDSTFANNYSGGSGGAMNGGNATDSTFTGNSSGGNGGAMHNGSAFGCSFTSNAAAGSGGAAYAISAYDCSFTTNMATNGGGVYLTSSPSQVVGCAFTGNVASALGGAIGLDAASNSVVASCQISSNSAGFLAGGIWLTSGGLGPSVVLGLTTICSNTPTNLNDYYIDGGGNQISEVCDDVSGACCINGGCLVLTTSDCDAVAGVYLGYPDCAGAECAIGACCIGGDCLAASLSDCFAAGGSFAGLGTDCAGVRCEDMCLGDLDGDGSVGFSDLVTLLAAWGACP